MCTTFRCASSELFVSPQSGKTQTWVPVNLRVPPLPGKPFSKQTGDKLSKLCLCSCMQVSGLGDKSKNVITSVYVHLFIRAQEKSMVLSLVFTCSERSISMYVICILTVATSEEKHISAYLK